MKRLSQVLVLVICIFFVNAATASELHVIFTSTCPVTTKTPEIPKAEMAILPIIGAAIVTNLAEGLIDNGVNALVKSLKPDALTMVAQKNMNGFYDGKSVYPGIGCMIAIIADRPTSNTDKPVYPFSDKYADKMAGKNLSTLIHFAGAPKFYMESTLQISKDNSAFSWKPVYIYGGEFLKNSMFAGNKRDWALAIQLAQPGGNKIAEVQYRFVNTIVPIELDEKQLESQAGAWNPMPDQDDGRIKSSKGKYQLNRPFTAIGTFVETPKPNQLQTIVVGALDKESKTIADAIKDEVIADRKKGKEEAKKDADLKTISDYGEAWAKYKTDCGDATVYNNDQGKKLSCQLAFLSLKTASDNANAAHSNLGSLVANVKLPDLPIEPK